MTLFYQYAQAVASKLEVANTEEETIEPMPGKPTWSGSISMELVGVRGRAYISSPWPIQVSNLKFIPQE